MSVLFLVELLTLCGENDTTEHSMVGAARQLAAIPPVSLYIHLHKKRRLCGCGCVRVCVWVCVCVRACVCERERERESVHACM